MIGLFQCSMYNTTDSRYFETYSTFINKKFG